jgi:hypothetical protein
MFAMKNTFVALSLLILGVLPPQAGFSQSASIAVTSGAETVTNTEPARIKLAQLYKMADIVAEIRVVAGDSEGYDVSVSKAVVVRNFKGTADGKILYFGPFTGDRLGWHYIVFLRNAKGPAVPKDAKNSTFGAVKYLEVFNEGYSSMEASYACIFDGAVPSQSCDYGVRVCTDYIVLPKGVRAFPPEENDPPFGCRWVKKSKFLSLLDELAEQPGVVQLPASGR